MRHGVLLYMYLLYVGQVPEICFNIIELSLFDYQFTLIIVLTPVNSSLYRGTVL